MDLRQLQLYRRYHGLRTCPKARIFNYFYACLNHCLNFGSRTVSVEQFPVLSVISCLSGSLSPVCNFSRPYLSNCIARQADWQRDSANYDGRRNSRPVLSLSTMFHLLLRCSILCERDTSEPVIFFLLFSKAILALSGALTVFGDSYGRPQSAFTMRVYVLLCL